MTWISVKERLPKEYKHVLSINMKHTTPEIKIDYVIQLYTKPIWGCRLHEDIDEPTHWMPLPEAPKDELV